MSNSAKGSLLESLNAYVKPFKTPNTREDLLRTLVKTFSAIASSILTFQQKQENTAISNKTNLI